MRADPTGQFLIHRRLGEGVITRAQHGHEDSGLKLDLAVVRVMDRDRRTGVIDEHLFAGAMFVAQHQIQLLQPVPVELAETAITVTGVVDPVFFPD